MCVQKSWNVKTAYCLIKQVKYKFLLKSEICHSMDLIYLIFGKRF